MSLDRVLLAFLMGVVTYPSRALPWLAPGLERLPPRALDYLRLVGPAVLAALAVSNVVILLDAAGHPAFHVGAEWLALAAGLALVAWRRNLFLGLIVAAALAAAARALGV